MAKKNSVTKLNIKQINKEVKKHDVKSKGFVEINGKEYEIEIKEHFTETEIQELIKDLMVFVQEAIKVQEDSNFDMLEYAIQYSGALIIKHFSSLDVPDDVYEIIATSKKLVDLNIMVPILGMFPVDQINKVNERAELALSSIGAVAEDLLKEERQEKVKEDMKKNVRLETEEEIKDSEKMIEDAMKENATEKDNVVAFDKDGE